MIAERSTIRVDSGTSVLRRNLLIAGVAGGAAVALFPLDRQIAEGFRNAEPQRNQLLRSGARIFNALGGPGVIMLGVGTYGVGRIGGSDAMVALGLHLTEAIVVGSATTSLIKGLAGRQRPFLDQKDSDEFLFGHGFTGNNLSSFPSGHTTTAFAAAAAITSEVAHRSPARARVVGPLLFGAATMVGLARIFDNQHWASDVAVGAGIGTLSGLSVVGYAYAHPHNRIERWLGGAMAPSIAPSPHGLALSWNITTR